MSRLVLACLLMLAAALPVRAELLGRFTQGGRTIELSTDACRGDPARKRALARQGRQLRSGCWSVDGDGNPVIRWRDGRQERLDGSRVRLAPKYAALLEDPPRRPSARQRPSWCPRARFPHERTICADPALAAQDLRLAPLWRDYKARMKLTPAQQAWHKSDFFGKLKACRTDRACIAREQAARRTMYEQALGRR